MEKLLADDRKALARRPRLHLDEQWVAIGDFVRSGDPSTAAGLFFQVTPVWSPDGKEIAFIARGDVFVTSVEGSTTKQITKTPEIENSVSITKSARKRRDASTFAGSSAGSARATSGPRPCASGPPGATPLSPT